MAIPPYLFDDHRDNLIYILEGLTQKECMPKLYVILFALRKFEQWQVENQPELTIDDLYP